MSTIPTPPSPEEADTPPEAREEADAARYPAHENPEEARERAGLDDRGHPEPEGAPRPPGAETGTPTPSAGEQD